MSGKEEEQTEGRITKKEGGGTKEIESTKKRKEERPSLESGVSNGSIFII